MGGPQLGFQILRETPRLANFIRWVGEQRPDNGVALIVLPLGSPRVAGLQV